jgi:hypothetical protein
MYQKDHQPCSQQHGSPQMVISISFVPCYTCLILFIGNFICFDNPFRYYFDDFNYNNSITQTYRLSDIIRSGSPEVRA